MDFHITLDGRGDLAAQVYRQFLEAILDGRLRQGERLPPTRELARSLGISRNTVGTAYERLTSEGLVAGRAGAGTFVSAGVRPRPRRAPSGGGRPRLFWRDMPEPEPYPEGFAYDFRTGTPDVHLFPLRTWRRLLARELRPSALTGYGTPEGHPALRAAIARYFGTSRSVRADAADVLVTQGAQQALDLIGRVLVEPGARVAVEDPGYPPARDLLRSLGARVADVPVDGEGLRVDALPGDARLVYVTPSHQFPLGTPMSPARRTALLEWARRHDAMIVEDDYDSEFRYGGRPLQPLQSLDRDGRVIYVGSFSKTLLPALRTGFLVAPASLRPALRAAKRLTDWHGDPITQAALARFIDEGLLARHIRRAGREYAARRAQIIAALDAHPGTARVPSAAGLHLCVEGAGLDALVAPAAEAGIAVESLARYCTAARREGLVIGFGAVSADRAAAGARRLLGMIDDRLSTISPPASDRHPRPASIEAWSRNPSPGSGPATA
ncbi:MocR-like pyridoxine biosynthesis transcription factor PdxR [Actinomadura macrotermitis]|uniref:HTH-type transcriptional regulatory protein GabR n=1 Tax=Actinomadura macrotermitis TaxID=2585200 RepID=A0A7K0C7I8_9ACTN|nr:PLP-dependent aminotransferase family protein [Actinomadura macrotermitis]MQY09420.1 HTH-type transcriptional regulatory protein GabR [Actinomadura macrotermitis]